jgi:hypothetical protein
MSATSREIYKKITENGLLAHMEEVVYTIIYNHGPITAKEIHNMVADLYPPTSTSPIPARLRTKGVAKKIGKRRCTITGNNADVWITTNDLPKTITPLEKAKQTYRRAKRQHEMWKKRRLAAAANLKKLLTVST